jgi:hypothetical protein
MSRNKKQEIPLWAKTGHGKPVSRRDFLAAGLIPFSATMMMPQWLNLLMPSNAFAATNCPNPTSDMIPFITLNLSGGAGLSGNYIALDQGGQMLPSYTNMGLGKAPPVEREFGNVGFAGMNGGALISKFLQGVRETAPNGIQKTAFVAVCVRSRDDSSENKFAADGLLARAGLMGSLLPNLGRRANTVAGIGQAAAVLPPPAPLIVNSFTALANSLGYAGALGTVLKPQQKEALARLVSQLSASQTRKLASVQSGDEIKTVLDCAGIKNEDLLKQGTGAVDPRLDMQAGAQINTIWNINAGTAANNQDLIFASMAYNALKNQCGSVALELGGYDYHDNTRTTGDTRDLAAGRNIGRMLETANALNRPVYIYVTSDGATSSAQSDTPGAPWTSDRGTAGLAFILYFNPAGRPATSGSQIGFYTAGQVASEAFVTGSSPEAAAAAVFANYLAIQKKLDLFPGIAGRVLDSSQLDQVLKFT